MRATGLTLAILPLLTSSSVTCRPAAPRSDASVNAAELASEPEAAPAAVVDPAAPTVADEVAAEKPPADPVEFTDRSGINDAYYKQTNAQTWVKRFEDDAREVHNRKPDILAALAIAPGQAIADIGAGTGLFTSDFARLVGAHGRVHAVDIQGYFLDHIRARTSQLGLTNINFVLATANDCTLAAGSIDLAFLSDTYHHIEDAPAYLASLRRALRPGGRLVVIDFDYTKFSGEKSEWMREHVRSTPEQSRKEIESTGFHLVAQHDMLKENYFFVFEVASAPAHTQ